MNVDQLKNEIWITRFRKGDESALKTLFNFFGRPLFLFAKNIVEVTEDAEDIEANTFIKAWAARATFTGFDNVRAFMYTTARNECLNLLKHKKRKRKSLKELSYLKNESDEDFFNRIIQSELLNILAEEIEKLPPVARRICTLSLKGLKAEEISKLLSMPAQNVRNNKSRAVQLLRVSFEKRIFSVVE